MRFFSSFSFYFIQSDRFKTNRTFLLIEGTDENGSSYGKTYWISTHFMAFWDQANDICHSNGMEFLSLETLQESNNLLSLCDQNIHLFDQWTHVGGLTTVPKSKDHWYWMTSGNKVNYSLKFGIGQPDNAGGNEMCLSIGKQPGNFFFNDVNCYGMHQFKFICQTLQF